MTLIDGKILLEKLIKRLNMSPIDAYNNGIRDAIDIVETMIASPSTVQEAPEKVEKVSVGDSVSFMFQSEPGHFERKTAKVISVGSKNVVVKIDEWRVTLKKSDVQKVK